MLEMAALHKQEIQEWFARIAFDDTYKFFNAAPWSDGYEPHESTWDFHEFASLHNGEVIGYIAYSVNRVLNHAYGLQIANFSKNKLRFGKDVHTAIDDVFCKFNLSKLKYSVVCGNPIEPTYDKLTKKYGGRIVGVERQEIKLFDGSIYDHKLYEMFREDYISNRRRR